jgi:hypothetical protein
VGVKEEQGKQGENAQSGRETTRRRLLLSSERETPTPTNKLPPSSPPPYPTFSTPFSETLLLPSFSIHAPQIRVRSISAHVQMIQTLTHSVPPLPPSLRVQWCTPVPRVCIKWVCG